MASRKAHPVAGWIRSIPGNTRRATTVALTFLLAVALTAGSLSTRDAGLPYAHPILVYDTADVRMIRIAETAHPFTLSDRYASSMQVSLDHSAAAVLIEEDAWYAGSLYYLTDKANILVDDNVYQFVLSDSGRGIAYLRDFDREAGTGDLYLYNGKERKPVATGVHHDSVQISPDGKSVAYAVREGADSPAFTGYIAINGKKPAPLGRRRPLAVSNGGKYVYALQADSLAGGTFDLYLKRGRKETLLRAGLHAADFRLILNEDYSEAIINGGGRSYLTVKGAEPEPIGRYPLRAVVADNRIPGRTTNYGAVTVYKRNSLRNTAYFNGSNDIVYLPGSGESTVIQRSSHMAHPVDVHLYVDGFGFNWTAYVDEAQTALLYIDEHRRLFRKSLDDPMAPAKLLADNAHCFVASPDLRHIYFMDDGHALYYIGGRGKPKQLAADVDRMKLVTSPDGETVYFLDDYRENGGTLYASSKGRKPRQITEDVHDMFSTPLGVGYARHDAGDRDGQAFALHFSRDGKTFPQIGDGVKRLRQLY